MYAGGIALVWHRGWHFFEGGIVSREAVQQYYQQFDEWARLDSAPGQLEFIRCMSVLDDHLPSQARVLDVGGGPGRYAVELARRGHKVSLVDLCEHHVELAQQVVDQRNLGSSVEMVRQGDACDLSDFEDDSFDAVVAFGPFYHLVDETDRRNAAAELSRVVRDTGMVFVQFVPPLSGLMRLMDRAEELPQALTEESFHQAHEEYVYHNPSQEGFQEAAYMTPGQVKMLFGHQGFESVDTLSVFGLAAGRESRLCEIQARDPELYEAIASVIEDTCREPSIIDTGHLAMWVGRRAVNQ